MGVARVALPSARSAGSLDGLPAEQVRRQERVERGGRGALLVLLRPQPREGAAPAVLQHDLTTYTSRTITCRA